MEAHQVFTFAMDSDLQKLVAVRRDGRNLEVEVRYAGDTVFDEITAKITNALDVELRTDELGVIIEWKQPMVPGWDWLTYSRRRRF